MIPIIAVVGRSNTGKTTLMERLVRELKQKGYRIAAVKHAAQELDMDKPGSDSSRLAEAGADAVWVNSPLGLYMHRTTTRNLRLDELPYYIGPGFDLILAEGFKESAGPKIEVHRREIGGELLSLPHQLLAVVSDEALDVDVPLFSWDEAGELAELIEMNFLSQPPGEAEMDLFVEQNPIALNPFMVNILNRTVTAMVSVLKGVGEIRSVSLHFKKNTGPERRT
ncbi:MAG: molybdopterin-guanine dinucleotide biosynthesis protein B [Chloroflexi bacterium]|nr:molybdopterin-guanine dinucleotide biosynthesis protein B [Chloroflexota bacterium]